MVRGLAFLLVLFSGASALGGVAYRCEWDGVARAKCCCPAITFGSEVAETRGERCCCSIEAAAGQQTLPAIEHDRPRCVDDVRAAPAILGAPAPYLVDPSPLFFCGGREADTALPPGTPRFLRLRVLLN